MSRKIRNLAPKVAFVGSFPGEMPSLELPEVAFAGRSNVGKSSALNTLLGSKKVARVSQTPGRTQAINLFRIGEAAVFADLPGYGFAKVPDEIRRQWKPMIEAYLSGRDDLRLVVVLVDARRDPQTMDGQLIYTLTELGIPALVVATKVDKLSKNKRFKNLSVLRKEFRLERDQPVAFSSVTREGRNEVWDRIEEACG